MQQADFVEFLRSWYGLPNLVLVLAGAAEVVAGDGILQQVRQVFNKQHQLSQDRVKKKTPATTKFNQVSSQIFAKQRLHLESRKIEQAHFILGWPAPNRHDDQRYALSLLSNILGGNMSSRLFSEVREKRGLAYYVTSRSASYHDVGVFGAAAGVDPNRLEEALRVTKAQFTTLASGENLITEGELKRAKEYAAGKMALGLENAQSVARYYGSTQLLAKPGEFETPFETLEKIQAVSLAEVQVLAEAIIKPGQMRLALIGPFA